MHALDRVTAEQDVGGGEIYSQITHVAVDCQKSHARKEQLSSTSDFENGSPIGWLRPEAIHADVLSAYAANHDAHAALTPLECGACTDWTA